MEGVRIGYADCSVWKRMTVGLCSRTIDPNKQKYHFKGTSFSKQTALATCFYWLVFDKQGQVIPCQAKSALTGCRILLVML